MAIYSGAGGIRWEIAALTCGVGGVARTISEGYAGVNGVVRKVFESTPVQHIMMYSDHVYELRVDGAYVGDINSSGIEAELHGSLAQIEIYVQRGDTDRVELTGGTDPLTGQGGPIILSGMSSRDYGNYCTFMLADGSTSEDFYDDSGFWVTQEITAIRIY